MIISTQHNVAVFNAPKTGTRYMFGKFYDANDGKCFGYSLHATPAALTRAGEILNVDIDQIHKVSIARNPWERYASLFEMHWNLKERSEAKSNEFVNWIMSEHFSRHIKSLDPYLINVDEVLQVEQWDECINRLEELLDHKIDQSQVYQPGYQYDETYKQWYTQQTIDIIAEKEIKTIELLGYTF
jgi:hypothetical protein